MHGNLEIFRMANALALHSSARQAEIAANVANADSPGYRATDITPFSDIYDRARNAGGLHATRPGHLALGIPEHGFAERIEVADSADPNGNTVSLEAEMIKSVETQHAHETALSVYETARNILRTSLGRGR